MQNEIPARLRQVAGAPGDVVETGLGNRETRAQVRRQRLRDRPCDPLAGHLQRRGNTLHRRVERMGGFEQADCELRAVEAEQCQCGVGEQSRLVRARAQIRLAEARDGGRVGRPPDRRLPAGAVDQALDEALELAVGRDVIVPRCQRGADAPGERRVGVECQVDQAARLVGQRGAVRRLECCEGDVAVSCTPGAQRTAGRVTIGHANDLQGHDAGIGGITHALEPVRAS